MRKGIFLRLALTNIKKNRGTYIPYMISCAGCISVLYIMFFIIMSPDTLKMRGGDYVTMILSMGVVVLGIFSLIFLLYCNSFLMRRRQKEIGLYNVLGMEKRHISRMLLTETVITGIISFILGIGIGILGSKLALLILLKALHVPAEFGFFVSLDGIGMCSAFYGVILILTLVNNIARVHVSRPVELLSGGKKGEKEPRTKLLMALLGFLCLGTGYYLAVTTEDILATFLIFFVAVLLVMAGTYLVFTAGSIVVLKLMRRNKSFYYKIQNFTSVSGMLYRMKQNAVGLASICILSTGVLLMISGTVSLNMGIEDMVDSQYPHDVNVDFHGTSLDEAYAAEEMIKKAASEAGIPEENVSANTYMTAVGFRDGNRMVFSYDPDKGMDTTEIIELAVFPERVYERITGEEISLAEGSVYAYGTEEESLIIGGEEFPVAGRMEKKPILDGFYDTVYYTGIIYLAADDNTFKRMNQLLDQEIGMEPGRILTDTGIMVSGDDEAVSDCRQRIEKAVDEFRAEGYFAGEGSYIINRSRVEAKEQFYGFNGGLLFLGLLLGSVFLMGTALIIYYKQISEGYEDRERFQIMRKVGMSRKEVRSSIRRQILMVFFLPLTVAYIHIAMAFPLVRRLLLLVGMSNTKLYLACTVGTGLVFAAVYGLIYLVTAKSYYRILEKAE